MSTACCRACTSHSDTSSTVSLAHLWNMPLAYQTLPMLHADTSSTARFEQLENM